jgi:hypothetical protein
LGFSDTDFAGGGSDRLIDALIMWGVQAIGPTALPDERLLGLLAPGP